jgi:hypothetical protein
VRTIRIKIENYGNETPELVEKFKELGLQEFDSLEFQYHNIPAGYYNVETKFIFNNQYNTQEGYRIFEKCTSLNGPKMRKGRGYYISEGIEDIREYQSHISTCGYCGKQFYDTKQIYCENCLGNEYLKEDDLDLLILKPILSKENRVIPSEYKEEITQKYYIAQGLGKEKRDQLALSKNRKKVENLLPEAEGKAQQLIEAAKKQTVAFTWLLDNGFNILDNVIYYDHSDKFCFGWYKTIDDETMSKLLNKLSEFPFDYEFKKR